MAETFGQVGDSRENNFDFLRFVMASLVILCDCFPILYGKAHADDWLAQATHRQENFGNFAVQCFFLISGYLIVRSWIFSKSPGDYFKKRALRILPALVGVFLVSIFLIGPLATRNRADYFRNPAAYKYAGLMLHKDMEANDKLPGVFVDNPMPNEVNTSLWTIRYEIVCYLLVALLAPLGAYRKPGLVAAVFGLNYLAFALHSLHILHLGQLGKLAQLITYFSIGMLFYLYRARLPYSRNIALFSVAVLPLAALAHGLFLVMPFASAYLLFYVAFRKNTGLEHFARRGDFSYGIYLYAFPLQQLLVHFFPTAFVPITLFLAAFCGALIGGMLSWFLIERPFLSLKARRATPAAAPA